MHSARQLQLGCGDCCRNGKDSLDELKSLLCQLLWLREWLKYFTIKVTVRAQHRKEQYLSDDMLVLLPRIQVDKNMPKYIISCTQDQITVRQDGNTQEAAQDQATSRIPPRDTRPKCRFGGCCNPECPSGVEKCWHKDPRECPFFPQFKKSGKNLDGRKETKYNEG